MKATKKPHYLRRVLLCTLCSSLLFTASACKGKDKLLDVAESLLSSEKNNAKKSAEKAQETSDTQDASKTQSNAESSETNVIVPGSGSWSKFYENYAARIGTVTDELSNLEDTSFVMNLFAFMSGDIDLAFTNAFFTPDAKVTNEMVYGMFGSKNIKYSESGDTATITGTDTEGKAFEYSLRYDGSTSAEYTALQEGKKTSSLSICMLDDYIAKVYHSFSGDTPEEIHVLYKKNGDAYVGINKEKPSELSLFKNANAAADPAFISSMEEYHIRENGKISHKP